MQQYRNRCHNTTTFLFLIVFCTDILRRILFSQIFGVSEFNFFHATLVNSPFTMTTPTSFVTANLLLCPPQAPTIVRRSGQTYNGNQQEQKFLWSGRFSFDQQTSTSTIRDQFALLFVRLQRADPSIQILPFDSTSKENPITIPKNLPYDDSLSTFL